MQLPAGGPGSAQALDRLRTAVRSDWFFYLSLILTALGIILQTWGGLAT